MTIRPVTPDDAKALLAVYAPYVTETAITFEYDAPSEEEFRERIIGITSKFPYLMAEENGKVLGYTYANTFRTRPAYKHCVETTIYIDKSQRHRGIGRTLYAELEKQLKAMGILNLNASITTTDFPDEHLTPASELFHKSLGYTKVAHFHKCGYKYGRWYDMIWMEKMIGEHRVPYNN
ncbi:MAG: N-acetyltransferase [Prevotella sp.]|nr:N-acetyltransferase [Candidatus Prevotella equi]